MILSWQARSTAALANTTIESSSEFGTLGLGNANCFEVCDFSISGAELQNITAENLLIKASGEVFVDGVQLTDVANIANTVEIYTGTSIPGPEVQVFDTIFFVNAPSEFKNLELDAGGIEINADVTTSGFFTATAGLGGFIVNAANVVSNGNPINILTDDIQLSSASSLNSGIGPTTIVQATPGTSIGLGAGAGTLSLTDLELDSILAANLNIGN